MLQQASDLYHSAKLPVEFLPNKIVKVVDKWAKGLTWTMWKQEKPLQLFEDGFWDTVRAVWSSGVGLLRFLSFL